MKAGDKVLNIQPKDFGMSSFRVAIDQFVIEKISKDWRKARDSNGKIAYWENLAETRSDTIRFLKMLRRESNFVVRKLDKHYSEWNPEYTVFKCSFDEDAFDDDKYHIRIDGSKHWTVKEAKNVLYLEDGWTFCKTLADVADCIAQNEGLTSDRTFLEKYNKWQEKFGYDKTDKIWTDYLGGTTQLEWAIDNDIDCLDYDRWQLVQKLLKHELKYETANDIFNTLYEKEDIEIFDCE